MALVILGSSKCCICNNIINENDNYRGFPAFISNTKDSLYKFNDAVLHKECLENDSLKDKLIKHLSLFENRLPPSEQTCIVDGLKMKDPMQQFNIGLLTSNEDDPLYKYNYIILNKHNINKWTALEEFISEVEKYLEEDKYKGFKGYNYLKYLIDEITKHR